jgi:hypothetical protein
MPYQRLDGAQVARTINRLAQRIEDNLPGHPGIAAVARELGTMVEDVGQTRHRTARRRRIIRWVSWVLIAALAVMAIVAVVSAVRDAVGATGKVKAFEWLPVLESGINDLVFAGIAIWFLSSLGNRVVRNDLIRRLYRLRSLAHIIDMHQMSKDPADLLPDSAPFRRIGRHMRPRDYAFYLDYCSELLSLTSKAAALCAEEATDPLVLDTVSEIEVLTNGMSRKIWQKITLLQVGRAAD